MIQPRFVFPFLICLLLHSPRFLPAQSSSQERRVPVDLATIPPDGIHWVRPRAEVVEAELIRNGLVDGKTDPQARESAIREYYRRFEKTSSRWVSAAVEREALNRERELQSATRDSVRLTGAGEEPSLAVQSIRAAIFVLAVEFGGPDTFQVSTWEGGHCVAKQITTQGPLKGQIPAPGANDNFSIWYRPDQVADPRFYENLIFGTEGIGRVRMDLKDPVDGKPGINLAGQTVQSYYESIAGPGNVVLEGSVQGWVKVAHSEAYYGADGCYGHDTGGPGSHLQLAIDSLGRFKQLHPEYYNQTGNQAFWPQYDRNRDGLVDSFWVIHAGAGQEEGGGAEGTGAIWSFSSDARYGTADFKGIQVYEGDPSTDADDIFVGPYTMQPENSGLGVLVHEFGHNLFGVPDLYVTDGDTSIGHWDPWDSGSWLGWLGGATPPAMSLLMRQLARCGNVYCNWQEPLEVRRYDAREGSFGISAAAIPLVSGSKRGIRIDLPDQLETLENRAGAEAGVYSGTGANRAELTLERTITVPRSSDGILRFDCWWDLEQDWDYVYVEVRDGGKWTRLADLDGVTTNENPNGNNLGNGITGKTSGPEPILLRFDLSRWLAKGIPLRFRYLSDVSVTNAGFWFDNVRVGTNLVDDFSSASPAAGIPGWTNSTPGWRPVPDVAAHSNFYLVEWRDSSGFDAALSTSYFYKKSTDEETTVGRIAHNLPGALVYYRDGRFPYGGTYRENLYRSPSVGPKNGILLVDQNFFPDFLGNPDRTLRKRLSSYDGALTLQPAPAFTIDSLWEGGQTVTGPWHIPAKPAVTFFDDAKGMFAGFWDCQGGVCLTSSDDGAVIPARGRYPTRITDENLAPLPERYGETWAFGSENEADGVGQKLGTGDPEEWCAQYGVRLDLISKAADGRTGRVRVSYKEPPSGPNLDILVSKPRDFLVGGVNFLQLEVANIGLSATKGKIRLIGDLPPGIVFQGAETTDWKCSGSESGFSCERSVALQGSEKSAFKVFFEVSLDAVPYGWENFRVEHDADICAANNSITIFTAVHDSRVSYFPQIGDGVVGNGRFTTALVFANNGESTALVQLEFFSSDGTPMIIPLGEKGAGSFFQFELARGNSIALKSSGTGRVRAGYARITAPESIGGTAIFSYSESGTTMFEAGVPKVGSLREFSLFMEADGAVLNTGLAVVNAGTGIANPVFRLYDDQFRLSATRTLADLGMPGLEPGCHLARYATEIFAGVAGSTVKRGMITIESRQPLAAVTLHQNDNPAVPYPRDIWKLSAFPVIEGRADSTQPGTLASSTELYFPQVGNGVAGDLGFKTRLLFVALDRGAGLTLEFFGSDGKEMKVDLAGYGNKSRFDLTLAKGKVVFLETSGKGSLQVGYARIRSEARVAGTAVFLGDKAGVAQFEAGVPAVQGRRSFTIYYDTSEGGNTGLAIVNLATSDARTTVRVYNSNFRLLETKTLAEILGSAMPAGNHLARFAHEIFPTVIPALSRSGIITVESEGDLAPVTLRQIFPANVFVLTAFPAMTGRADQ